MFGFCAALTRITGVMLVFAYFAEWMEYGQVVGRLMKKDWKGVFKYILTDGLYVILIPLGVAVYMMINYIVAGDPLIFLEYQKSNWYQETQFFGKTFKMMTDYAANGAKIAYSSFIPQMLIIPLTIACGFYGLGRHRMMYYGMLLPFFITNISASWPISGGRYATCIFPLFLILAEFAEEHKKIKDWIAVIFAVLFGMFLTLYFKGSVV